MKQSIREDGPDSHLKKAGTPTMGGGLVLISILIPCFLWVDLFNPLLWAALSVTCGFALIGYIDDSMKVSQKNSNGLSGPMRLVCEFFISGITVVCLVYFYDFSTRLYMPFFKDWVWDLGFLYVPFASFIIVGCANSVNLTDGLDGLAIFPVIVCAATFAVFAYLAGHFTLAEYLQIPYIQGAGELAPFCAMVVAAGLGFLWFNSYPAQVFMGDVGSLGLGGFLGIMAVLTKNELLLALLGGIFVVEALSVISQVLLFKTTGKRIFKMAPIHHHFELKGLDESKIIIRFWIVSILLALLSISTLKLR